MKRCTKISIEESRGKKKQQVFFIDKSGVQVRTFFGQKVKFEIWFSKINSRGVSKGGAIASPPHFLAE